MKILNNMFKNIPILFTLLLIYCRLCNGEYFMCRIAETSPDRNGIPLVFYYTSEETNILLVYIYYFCLFIMIALLIAHIALDLTDYFFSCFKQSLSQFDEIYQNHHIVYVVFKFIGVMFIALIIMIPVSWKVETILDYNSLAEKIIWNYDNYENVPVTIESVSTVVTWDNTIIIITGYVLIYSLLSLYSKKSNSFLNRISFYVFLPIYPFDVFFCDHIYRRVF